LSDCETKFANVAIVCTEVHSRRGVCKMGSNSQLFWLWCKNHFKHGKILLKLLSF